MPEVERLARAALSAAIEPGDGRTSSLLQQIGPLRTLEHSRVPKPDSRLAERLDAVDPAVVLEEAERVGIRFVVPGDPEWPSDLDDLDDAIGDDGVGGTPPGVWVRGPVRLGDLAGAVAVVGSRAASVYGVETTRHLCAQLARAAVPVVSGGALGIDVAAHDATLGARGVTVAVLACGLDRVYPTQNTPILRHLAAEHALVSEQPPGSGPTRPRFLARNRLIAALTRGTVLVEAAVRSGALNTLGWAERLQRQVMCVPGPVTSVTSAGAHVWLRDGRATLVTSGADVLELVSPMGEHLLEVPRGPERPRDRLSAVERQVVEQVPVSDWAEVDTIAIRASLHVRDTEGALRRLESRGLVRLGPAGWRLAPDP